MKRSWPLLQKRGGIFSLLLMATLLTGCFQPREKEVSLEELTGRVSPLTSTTFYALKLSGQGHSIKSSNLWDIPEQRAYNFNLCLVDRATRSMIVGHRFKIKSENNTFYQAATGSDGCLVWQEKLSFNFFAPAKYVVLTRKIRGEGVRKGEITVKIAVNPWSNYRGKAVAEVVDLEKFPVPSEQISSDSNIEALTGSKIWVGRDKAVPGLSNISGMIIPKAVRNNGIKLEIKLSLSPQVKVENSVGAPFYHTLTSGKFRTQLFLFSVVERNDQQQRALLASVSSDEYQTFDQGRFATTLSTLLTRRPTEGQLELGIRLIPEPGLGMDGNFEQLYYIGEFDHLIGSHQGNSDQFRFDPVKRVSLGAILDQVGHLQAMAESDHVVSLKPFDFKEMNVRFNDIEPGESATKRTLNFVVKSCVKHSLTGKAVTEQMFTVHKYDRITGKVRESSKIESSKEDGCLRWTDQITHKYYQPEKLLKKAYKIVHHPSGAEVKLAAYMNPWDYGWTFGKDSRNYTEEYVEKVNSRNAPASKLMIEYFRYNTIGFRYEIDQFLSLNVKKRILFTAAPKVLRYNSITRGLDAREYIRDGIYILKIGIKKSYKDPLAKGSIGGNDREYVYAVQKLVRVQYGLIITPLEIAMRDLRLMRIRSNFYVQLIPVDQSKLNFSDEFNKNYLDGLSASYTSGHAPEDFKKGDVVENTRQRLARLSNSLFDQETISTINTTFKNEDRLEFEMAPATASSEKTLDIDKISDQDRELLKLFMQNELPINSTNEKIDYAHLEESDSGLSTRTFVGPIVILSNSWTTSLRPTDDLNNNYFMAGGHGLSLSDRNHRPQTVSNLFPHYLDIKRKYQNRMTYQSLISSYVSQSGLHYTSLADNPLQILTKPLTSFDQQDIRKACGTDYIKECLVDSDQNTLNSASLIKYMNSQGNPRYNISSRIDVLRSENNPIKRADVEVFIRTGELDKKMNQGICALYMNYNLFNLGKGDLKEEYNGSPYYQRSYERQLRLRRLKNRAVLYNKCVEGELFEVARQLRTYEVSDYKFIAGKALNLNVGADFSIGHSDSISEGLSASAGMSVKPLGWLESIPFIGQVGKIFDISLGVSGSANTSRSNSVKSGSSISSGTYLAIQKAELDMRFTQFERCITIGLRDEVLNSEEFVAILKDTSEEDLYKLTKGMFICTGEREDSEQPFRERYYYFTQHFTQGDMLDHGELKNHPWLLALRGDGDYVRFVETIQGKEDLVEKNAAYEGGVMDFPREGLGALHLGENYELIRDWDNRESDLPSEPLDRLNRAYQMVTPSFPGIYTLGN
ncbi:MAG: hypothetical protein HN353_10300 [Bdellovibrionales bacterium]|nr:hypothetical protein [Bdellovibrionales bacterium]